MMGCMDVLGGALGAAYARQHAQQQYNAIAQQSFIQAQSLANAQSVQVLYGGGIAMNPQMAGQYSKLVNVAQRNEVGVRKNEISWQWWQEQFKELDEWRKENP